MSATALAVAGRFLLDPVLPAGYPFLTFFPAVVLTSVIAGLRWGLVVAVLGGIAALYFFIPPGGSLRLEPDSFIAILAYACIIGIDVWLLKILDDWNARMQVAEALASDQAEQLAAMLVEVQHRIGNNLQLVSALLQLESRDLPHPDAREALDRAVARLAVVGRIQRILAEANDREHDVAALLGDLARDAILSSAAERISVMVDGNAAIPPSDVPAVALIVLECVNNTIEHSFPGAGTWTLWITLQDRGSGAIVVIEDDGVGCDPERVESSLGMKLCGRLARSAGATLAVSAPPSGGTRTVLTLDRLRKAERAVGTSQP